jgi:hypothetical protein
MNRKKHTAIEREMNWNTAAAASGKSGAVSAHSHFTLIDARDLFTKKENGPANNGNLVLKIIYIKKQSKTNN